VSISTDTEASRGTGRAMLRWAPAAGRALHGVVEIDRPRREISKAN
jgi:hypothetical protein